MNWKIKYLFLKYRDYVINDQSQFEIKRRYNLSKDDYAVLSNNIKNYQIEKYGDILYWTGYDYHNKEEVINMSHRSAQRRRARQNRKGGFKDE